MNWLIAEIDHNWGSSWWWPLADTLTIKSVKCGRWMYRLGMKMSIYIGAFGERKLESVGRIYGKYRIMSWYSLLRVLVCYVLTIKGYFCNLIGDEDLAGGRVWSSSLKCLCGRFSSPSSWGNYSLVHPKWGSLNFLISCET